ncbi:STAS domain-containing protein [Glaciimonas sp. GG7]
MKIDAIASEMSSELTDPTTIIGTMPSDTATRKKIVHHAKPSANNSSNDFLGSDFRTASIEVSVSGTPAVVEEAALLFANSQSDIAEQLLKEAILEDGLGAATDIVWWMLLDLYHINGKQHQFDDLSVDFAHKFETSPPTWNKKRILHQDTDLHENSSPIPIIPFSGKLDIHISKQLERIQKLSVTHATLRLEFTQITSVDSVGCGLLLRMLKKLQKSGLELILVGTTELADNIRAILSVGRRDETTAPWLLLLEILHLLNNEQAFEDISIDYSITFEVSPPPFVAPVTKVTTANNETTSNRQSIKSQPSFQMPTLIEGRIDALLAELQAHGHHHHPALIDCSRLARIDFNAAGQLMNGLHPLIAQGRKIEFHDVNHLVAALFKVMGLYDVISIYTRKN